MRQGRRDRAGASTRWPTPSPFQDVLEAAASHVTEGTEAKRAAQDLKAKGYKIGELGS
jgi:hypothetical protein